MWSGIAGVPKSLKAISPKFLRNPMKCDRIILCLLAAGILFSSASCRNCGEKTEAHPETRPVTVNLRYTGKDGAARKFADEMISSGTVEAIRAEAGNLRYEYYASLDDPETILLIDCWKNQEAVDAHHATAMMKMITELREKYDLHMTVERYVGAETPPSDEKFLRK